VSTYVIQSIQKISSCAKNLGVIARSLLDSAGEQSRLVVTVKRLSSLAGAFSSAEIDDEPHADKCISMLF
jgi:hypothetical protein